MGYFDKIKKKYAEIKTRNRLERSRREAVAKIIREKSEASALKERLKQSIKTAKDREKAKGEAIRRTFKPKTKTIVVKKGKKGKKGKKKKRYTVLQEVVTEKKQQGGIPQSVLNPSVPKINTFADL